MIVDWLTNALRGAALSFDALDPKDPAIARILGLSREVNSGVQVDEHKVLGYPAVMRGVSILANVHYRTRPYVMERTDRGKRRATEHPSYRVVARKANTLQTAATVRHTLTHHALLWGNGFAYLERDGAGRVLSMTPCLPDRTQVVRAVGDQMETLRDMSDTCSQKASAKLLYRTRIGQSWQYMLPENVIHIRGLTFNGMVGVPVVEVLAESFGLGMAAREFGARFFGQGSTASGIIQIPGHLTEEADDTFLDSLKAAHRGLGKSHLIMLLEDGAKFVPTSIAPEHAQFLQTREFEVREVANCIGIQPHKLGDPSRKSFNSLEQSNQEHLDDDLDPWLGKFEEEYTEKTLTEVEKETDSHVVRFNRKSLLRQNLAARSAHYASGRQWGYYSANDVRRAENLDDIGTQGDGYLVPRNMMPADQAAQMTTAGGGAAEKSHRLSVHILSRLARRITKQAAGKAAKGETEFCTWLGELSPPADCPPDLAEACSAMVAKIKTRLEHCADTLPIDELRRVLAVYEVNPEEFLGHETLPRAA